MADPCYRPVPCPRRRRASAARLAQRGLARCSPRSWSSPRPERRRRRSVRFRRSPTSAKAIALAAPATLDAARGYPLYLVGRKDRRRRARAGLAPAAAAAAEIAQLLPALPAVARSISPAATASPISRPRSGRGPRHWWSMRRGRGAAGPPRRPQAVGKAAGGMQYSERAPTLAAGLAERAGLAALFRHRPHVCLSRHVAAPLAAFGVTRALRRRRPAAAGPGSGVVVALSRS